MNDFNDILHFDPLLAAEKITGKSYKDDPETSGLGFLLLQESAQRKKDELMLRGDTYWSMPFTEAVDIVLDLGFSLVYAQILPDNSTYGNGRPVHYYAYWRKGVLLTLESYGAEDDERGLTVNTASITFNWRTNSGNTSWPAVPFSGGWRHLSPGFDDVEGDPWTLVADVDVREGLRHKLDILESDGYFVEEWYSTPRIITVHSYAEREERESDLPWDEQLKLIDARNLARIKQFAEPARSAILGGRVGADWED